MRFLHTADLHLSLEAKDYALSVLEEIGAIARRERAAAILFAGDTFDTFPDALALRGEFARWADALPAGMEVIVLPGNHEDRDRGTNTLAALHFGGRVRLAATMPFELITTGDTEFLLFPFRSGYLDPASLQVPPRVAPSRVAVMHGTVAGMAYTGDGSEEAENSLIDPSMFGRMEANYAALGHLHGARAKREGETLIVYPGSARVWRKGERGPRTVSLVELHGHTATHRFIPLTAAGEYREYHIPVSLDGRAGDVERVASEWASADMVSIVLTGIVDDEHAVVALQEELRSRYTGRVRSFEIVPDVQPVAGIAAHPAASRFLALLAEREGSVPPEQLERARRLGLGAIAERMGSAS